jgi:hypothetical protein
MWSVQSPHKHRYTPKKHPKAGLAANFCRNPSNHRTLWCYTTDPKKRWDECVPRNTCPPVEIVFPPVVIKRPDPVISICEPPIMGNQCRATERMFGNGSNYRGY